VWEINVKDTSSLHQNNTKEHHRRARLNQIKRPRQPQTRNTSNSTVVIKYEPRQVNKKDPGSLHQKKVTGVPREKKDPGSLQ